MKVFEITFAADIQMDGNKQEIKLMVNDDKSMNAAIQMITADPRAELVSVLPCEINENKEADVKPEIKETRRLSASQVRQLCIKHRWYTCGTNEEYEAMFNKLYDADGFEVDVTAEKLFDIASDIYKHSEIEDYTVDAIMNVLAGACCYYYEFDREEIRHGKV